MTPNPFVMETLFFFFFTPRRFFRNKAFTSLAWSIIHENDLILLIMDVVKTIDSEAKKMFEKLEELKTQQGKDFPPVFLVLNKKDLLDKMDLKRDPIDRLEYKIPKLMHIFDQVFTVSALTGEGVVHLENQLLNNARSREWIFSSDTTTDLSQLQLCEEIVREKLFQKLNMEIPYMVKLETVGWTEKKDGTLRVDIVIYVPKASQMGRIYGTGGWCIKGVASETASELQYHFGRCVEIMLRVKADKLKYRANPQDVIDAE
eukprot:TRINITY_DN848_c0_g1_i6.p1 TRINITY_DN848_c0_g1~~TRINITY_DN848_c0_g1_i6.p1  ORF type:complete len:260 (-),score=58.11 TRINITY_DN848_c0_g1_i6:204-983(-)